MCATDIEHRAFLKPTTPAPAWKRRVGDAIGAKLHESGHGPFTRDELTAASEAAMHAALDVARAKVAA